MRLEHSDEWFWCDKTRNQGADHANFANTEQLIRHRRKQNERY